MSFGSEYRDRRRKNRRRDLRLVIYTIRSIVATASLVAIAFAFDLPEKIREKLRKPSPQATSQREVARNASAIEARKPPVAKESIEPPDNFPRERNSGQHEVAVEHRPVALPPAPVATVEAQPIEKLAVRDEEIGRHVKLRLDRKLMKIPLEELAVGETLVGRVRVIALRGLKEKFELMPEDGLVGADADLQILFPEYSQARILVRTDKIGHRIFLIVEPQMALWADEPMPYTVNKIKSEAYKTRRAADEFFVSLAANKAELPKLVNWLNAARNIPLADFNRGKLRVKKLEGIIKQMEGRVDEVSQGVQQVNALEQLALALHNQAVLQFEVVDLFGNLEEQ